MAERIYVESADETKLKIIAERLRDTWLQYTFAEESVFADIIITGSVLTFKFRNTQLEDIVIDISQLQYPATDTNAQIKLILERLGLYRPPVNLTSRGADSMRYASTY